MQCYAAFSQRQSQKRVIFKTKKGYRAADLVFPVTCKVISKEKGLRAANLLHFGGRYKKNGHHDVLDIMSP